MSTLPIYAPTPPTMRSLLDTFKQEIFKSFNCHQVGSIVSVDFEKNTVSVQLGMQQQLPDGTTRNYPVLTDCPMFIMCGGSSFIGMPVSPGDLCLVLFNDRDIDTWFSTGNNVIPNSQRTHDLSDGLALVGFRNLAKAITDYYATGIEIRSPAVDVTGNLNVSSGATDVFTSSDGATISVVNGIIVNIDR